MTIVAAVVATNHSPVPRTAFTENSYLAPNVSSVPVWQPCEPSITCVLCCAQLLQLCLTLCSPLDYSPPGSSVHGILQARMLEWVAMPFSRGSSQPSDQTQVSRIAGGFFTSWATREALFPNELVRYWHWRICLRNSGMIHFTHKLGQNIYYVLILWGPQIPRLVSLRLEGTWVKLTENKLFSVFHIPLMGLTWLSPNSKFFFLQILANLHPLYNF